jgi:hypothetical protein
MAESGGEVWSSAKVRLLVMFGDAREADTELTVQVHSVPELSLASYRAGAIVATRCFHSKTMTQHIPGDDTVLQDRPNHNVQSLSAC